MEPLVQDFLLAWPTWICLVENSQWLLIAYHFHGVWWGGREGGTPLQSQRYPLHSLFRSPTHQWWYKNNNIVTFKNDVEATTLRSICWAPASCRVHLYFPFTHSFHEDCPPVRGVAGAAAGLEPPDVRTQGLMSQGDRQQVWAGASELGGESETSGYVVRYPGWGLSKALEGTIMKFHPFLWDFQKGDVLTIIRESSSFFPFWLCSITLPIFSVISAQRHGPSGDLASGRLTWEHIQLELSGTEF